MLQVGYTATLPVDYTPTVASTSQQLQQHFIWAVQTLFNSEHDDEGSESDVDDGSIQQIKLLWNRGEYKYAAPQKTGKWFPHKKRKHADIVSLHLQLKSLSNIQLPYSRVRTRILSLTRKQNHFPLPVLMPLSAHSRLVQDVVTRNFYRFLESREISERKKENKEVKKVY